MKSFSKEISICLALIICVANIHAQVSLLRKTIEKIEGSKNLSYQAISKQQFAGSDTSITEWKATYLKQPQDINAGYLFDVESIGKNYTQRDIYNGQNLIQLDIKNSTYRIRKPDQP